MYRLRKPLLLVALVLASYFGIRRYLTSTHLAGQLAERLGALCGVPVQVDEIDVGMNQSLIRGVRFFERGAEADSEPWIVVPDADAELSLLSALVGDLPRCIVLRNAALTLRFDKDNHLLTRLPGRRGEPLRLPDVQLQQCSVTIRQEGRPDLVVRNVEARLREQDNRMHLQGMLDHPQWGAWQLRGQAAADCRDWSLNLTANERMHVTQEMLSSLPFVADKVWKAVQLEGDTPAHLTVRYDPEAQKVRYRIDLTPENTKVHVTSIDLHAEQARGTVVIEDKLVRLRDVHGHANHGEIETGGDLDFRSKPDLLSLAIKVTKLAVRELPRTWKIPPHLEGRVSGAANVVIAIADGRALTTGAGEGAVQEAKFLGLPVRAIYLQMISDGHGFQFKVRQP